jgi:protein gp37
MSGKSRIEWTESTWNPVTGCSKISPGCKNCYAERMARRLKAMGQKNYSNGFQVTLHRDALRLPLNWRKPQMIFVNSMSDLFHEEIPQEFIIEIFEIIAQSPQHCFQVLTKRAHRLLELDRLIDWPSNVWMGVTVENHNYSSRIDQLRLTGAAVKFISFEPLLGSIGEVNLCGIDWAIVGGESGPSSRPVQEKWVIELRDQCIHQEIPFFFKQWGGFNKKKNGRLLQGRIWDQMPSVINSEHCLG